MIGGKQLSPNADFLHLSRAFFYQRFALSFKTALDALPTKRSMAALRATPWLFVLVLADGAIKLFSFVQPIHALVVDSFEVIPEPDDVPAEIKQEAVMD